MNEDTIRKLNCFQIQKPSFHRVPRSLCLSSSSFGDLSLAPPSLGKSCPENRESYGPKLDKKQMFAPFSRACGTEWGEEHFCFRKVRGTANAHSTTCSWITGLYFTKVMLRPWLALGGCKTKPGKAPLGVKKGGEAPYGFAAPNW